MKKTFTLSQVLCQMNKVAHTYSDAKLWKKLKSVYMAAGLRIIYMVLLLFYVLKDENVSREDKALIYGALAYFIVPFDLIPDFIPIVGYSDDLTALYYALRAVWANVTPEMKQRAKLQLAEWFGAFDDSLIADTVLF